MVYKFFDKKTKDSGVTTLANKSDITSVPKNEQLTDKLHKPIITKLKKKSIFSIQRQYLGCSFSRYAIKDLDIYYVSLIFISNMLGFFL